MKTLELGGGPCFLISEVAQGHAHRRSGEIDRAGVYLERVKDAAATLPESTQIRGATARQLLGIATQTGAATQGPGGDEASNAPTTRDTRGEAVYTPCGCGGSVREGYVAQHTRSKKHQRWEKKNGA